MASTFKAWRSVSIFVSSTFTDMESERDYLRKVTVPALEEYFRDKYISVKFIDLRWGVNTRDGEAGAREAEVLKVCFDEINRSRPFFVALIGDRYGWVPPSDMINLVLNRLSNEESLLLKNSERSSVTALEILFGALGSRKQLKRSLFYFREADYSSFSPQQLQLYRDQDDDSQRKLASLREKITTVLQQEGMSQNIGEYKLCDWNKDAERFVDLDAFGAQLFEHLKREIESEIEESIDSMADDWYALEQLYIDEFIHKHTENFVGREHVLSSLAGSAADKRLVILSALSGFGKSSVMCMLYLRLLEHKKKASTILFHSAGISRESVYIDKMLQRWSCQLSNDLNIAYTEITEDTLASKLQGKANNSYLGYIVEQFNDLVAQAKERGHEIILIIDAFDRFTASSSGRYLTFVPDGVTLFISATPAIAAELGEHHRTSKVSDLDDFSYTEAGELIGRITRSNHKNLHSRVVEKLLSLHQGDYYAYRSPLWLSLAANLFFSLDNDDFRHIKSRSEADNEEKIENYLLELADNLPCDAGELFIELMKRASNYFGTDMTFQVFANIAATRKGLREKDLAALIGRDWNELRFASLRRWFRNVLIENSSEGQWSFAHNKIQEAVSNYFIDRRVDTNKAILAYIKTLASSDVLRANEFLYHMWACRADEETADFIANASQDSIESIKGTLYYLYHHNKPVEEWLVACIDTLDENRKCYFIGHLFKHVLSNFGVFHFDQYLSLCMALLDRIDIDRIDSIENIRVLGATLQDVSLWIKNKAMSNNAVTKLFETQVNCWQAVVAQNPKNETYKNSLCIGLMNLSEHYSARGEYEKAMEVLSRISLL